MPEEGDTVQFKSWSRSERHLVPIYADFEAFLKKYCDRKRINKEVIQKHYVMSYGLYVKILDNVPVELIEHFEIERISILDRGCESREKVVRYFIDTVVDISQKICNLFKTNTAITMSEEKQQLHAVCENCNHCKSRFTEKNYKVADHNHLSGRFRQSLCNPCNLNIQTKNFVLCFLHDLSNYHAHFIVIELGYADNEIKVIASSEDKYISFSKYIIKIFHILSSS